MARRKKEPRSVHREKIASAASVLFMDKGIVATSMDDIAKAAGYSKATLYVYFENKEEIVGFLVLDSMKKLYHYIVSALKQQETTKEQNYIITSFLRWNNKKPQKNSTISFAVGWFSTKKNFHSTSKWY